MTSFLHPSLPSFLSSSLPFFLPFIFPSLPSFFLSFFPPSLFPSFPFPFLSFPGWVLLCSPGYLKLNMHLLCAGIAGVCPEWVSFFWGDLRMLIPLTVLRKIGIFSEIITI
jgi:hypothetical protein